MEKAEACFTGIPDSTGMSQEGWSVDRFSERNISVLCAVWGVGCGVWWRSNGSHLGR